MIGGIASLMVVLEFKLIVVQYGQLALVKPKQTSSARHYEILVLFQES